MNYEVHFPICPAGGLKYTAFNSAAAMQPYSHAVEVYSKTYSHVRAQSQTSPTPSQVQYNSIMSVFLNSSVGGEASNDVRFQTGGGKIGKI